MTNAIIIVDVQNDFIEGGALAVNGGEQVALRLAEHLKDTKYDAVITTQDWHIDPGTHWAETPDFVDTWPVHCAAETPGAEIREELQNTLNTIEAPQLHIVKGEYEAAYSGFEGRNKAGGTEDVATLIRNLGVTDLTVVGLATDHCVKATALDALNAGFNVTVLTDYVAGVDPARSEEALKTLADAGATIK